MVHYTTREAAEKGQQIVNHAALRGKTCRCIFSSSVEFIRKTLDSGYRLVVESLDINIESRALWDIFALFGEVIDCKVELDDKERSRGFGFVHYSTVEAASQALKLVNRMQIGDSVVEVRPYERKDIALFTGCLYTTIPKEDCQ
eukprot:gnl/MRDRNA2_/MRDRNA2_160084_c0_seq1.p1 gnl/MRDRNA2_/MRDRNA2_160084_c0~~gnl/MRDRNA2_/MRDRNA2_160084_c0_seq1.p1  ORF type:complete len:162 (+),score=29.52 gnl/MRDRNA2_/MRDRNA2_160084_c0_seq1:57-488(+)